VTLLDPALSAIFLGFVLGLQHATDPDHLVAVATILTRERRFFDGAMVGVLWGAGHMTTLTIVGAIIIGLKLTIKQLQGTDFAALFYDETRRDGIDMVQTNAYLTTPGVLTYTDFFVQPDGLFNWAGYSNPAVVDLVNRSRAATDDAAAAADYVEAQALFAPDKLQISLGLEYARTFLNKRLTGVTTSFAYVSAPWALPRRIQLSSRVYLAAGGLQGVLPLR